MGRTSTRRRVVGRYYITVVIYNILHPTSPQTYDKVNSTMKLRSLYIRQETRRLHSQVMSRMGTICAICLALWMAFSYLDIVVNNVRIDPTYHWWNILAQMSNIRR